eukprot:m.33100 g.33100  ORF g.33100 m.33100 type:complete len:65 (+) comp7153_c0_seq1:2784-2978(+)
MACPEATCVEFSATRNERELELQACWKIRPIELMIEQTDTSLAESGHAQITYFNVPSYKDLLQI